jgi:S-adenosylmethionine:tRNA ribosyltransferase-isomerase
MMVVRRDGRPVEHRRVGDLPDYLSAGDLLVLNDTRVFAARVFGTWSDTPGRVEVLLVEPADAPDEWMALCRSSRPLRPGLRMRLAEGQLQAEVVDRDPEGRTRLRLAADGDLFELLDRHGVPPVPPYIHRETHDARVALDRERYQTVYARERGAVAAPTAGLHFTPELFTALEARGVARTHVTLHVGPGTFKPVKVDCVDDHVMDPERYLVPPAAARDIAAARAGGGRVVAVGSTSVRTLETVAAAHDGSVVPCEGRSRLFIRPPYAFRVVDALLTNFHLPRSTLLMMVSAFAGRERILAAYAEAVRERYRFFSYGDCMLLL